MVKKKKKNKKKNNLSTEDYKKIQKALKNYQKETATDSSDSNVGYIIGVMIFLILLVMKIIHNVSN